MPKLQITLGDDTWTLDATLKSLLNVEVMAIERATGMALVQFEQALNAGSLTAITGLIWVLKRRADPGLAFDAVEFALDDLATDLIPDEDDPVAQGKDEPSEPDTAST